MEITKGELKLISRLLEMAGNEFGKHGCNDMDQALWDEIGFTPEDRATLIHEMQLWNGNTEDPYPTKLIHMRDDMVMNFYADKLKNANLAGSPAPTPPLDVQKIVDEVAHTLMVSSEPVHVEATWKRIVSEVLRRHIASPAQPEKRDA